MKKVMALLCLIAAFSCGMNYSSLNDYQGEGSTVNGTENGTGEESIKEVPFKGLLIPAYFYDQVLWDEVVNLGTQNVVVVVNPDNGPGSTYDPNYDDFVRELAQVGKIPVGYIYTKWGSRPLSEVEADIDRWISYYPSIKGFFFDEASTKAEDIPYYRALADYVRSRGKNYVVLNPGTAPDSGYFEFADLILTYENSYESLDYIELSANPQKSACMVYGVPEEELDSAEERIRGYCSYIYLTDDDLPNPYDTLPPYIEREVEVLE